MPVTTSDEFHHRGKNSLGHVFDGKVTETDGSVVVREFEVARYLFDEPLAGNTTDDIRFGWDYDNMALYLGVRFATPTVQRILKPDILRALKIDPVDRDSWACASRWYVKPRDPQKCVVELFRLAVESSVDLRFMLQIRFAKETGGRDDKDEKNNQQPPSPPRAVRMREGIIRREGTIEATDGRPLY